MFIPIKCCSFPYKFTSSFECFIFQSTYFNGEKQSVFKIDTATKYAERDNCFKNIFKILPETVGLIPQNWMLNDTSVTWRMKNNLNNLWKFSSYLTVNDLLVHYKNQFVNALLWKPCRVLWKIIWNSLNTHCGKKMQVFYCKSRPCIQLSPCINKSKFCLNSCPH